MKVYLASQYARRDELRLYRDRLTAIGIEVTSRWLDENEPLDGGLDSKPDSWYIHTATVDLEDVDRADAVIFFSEDPTIGVKRGGRHVEFGYALKGGKVIYTIGPRENVFHYVSRVFHFDTLEQFIADYKVYSEYQWFNGE